MSVVQTGALAHGLRCWVDAGSSSRIFRPETTFGGKPNHRPAASGRTRAGTPSTQRRMAVHGQPWGSTLVRPPSRASSPTWNSSSWLCAANDLGLLAEGVDVATGEPLGNMPQALSHVGLVNAAQTLTQAQRGAVPAGGAT
jgi:hypothetical protein